MNSGSDTLARIDTAETPIVLLRGPARSGKTSALLACYHRAQGDAATSPALLVAPNTPSADALRTALLEARPSRSLLGPRVMTFDRLIGQILASADRSPRVIGAYQRHLLLGRLIRNRRDSNELPAIRAVADTPGVVTAVDHAIAELKRAAVEPEELSTLVPPSPDKRRDLANLYADYQAHLNETGIYDAEGLAWLARDVLAGEAETSPDAIGLGGVDWLLLDGFTDFTPTQLEIISLLASRVSKTVLTLPLDANDSRGRLWHWTARTAERIRRAVGDRLSEIDLPDDDGAPTRLGRVVFDSDATLPTMPEGFSVIATPGPDAEVEEVARRVKRRLLEGAAPGRIAVLARSMTDYRPRIQRAFREADIPLADPPTPLTDVPIVRFVLQAAQLGGGSDCEYTDVLNVLTSSYFRPESLGAFTSRDAVTAEMVIREANVFHGRDAYPRAAEMLADRAERLLAGVDDEETTPSFALGPLTMDPSDLRRAGDLLETLLGALQPARNAASLPAVMDALDLPRAALLSGDDELIARDLRALQQLRDALGRVEDESLGSADLREALSAVRLPGARGESVVDVLDVLDARAMRYDHVYLLGLSEGQFPFRPGEGAILTEADRRRCSEAGLAIDRRGDLTAREMLLFYLAITRAERSLTVSYQETDATGRSSAAGSFLQSTLDPLGGIDALGEDVLTRLPVGRFLPPADQIVTPRTAVMHAMAERFTSASTPATPAPATDGLADRLTVAGRGTFAMHRRWSTSPPDRWDGRLSDPKLLADLAERYPGRTVFSPSALNTFGQCPWQFFARYVLKLRPLAEPTRQIEAVSRGTFVHDVLCAVFSRLRRRAGGPVPLKQLDPAEASDLLDAALAEQSERVTPAYPALWEIQLGQMREQILEYILQQRSDAYPAQQACYMELGFGLGARGLEWMDPASSADPVRLDTPAGTLHLKGKIDRVDHVEHPDGMGWLVVDYKTGRLPSRADIEEGRSLQIPLYAEAVEQLLGGCSPGGAFHRVGAKLQERHFSAIKPPRKDSDFAERRDAIREVVGGFATAMSEGRFEVVPTHDCPGWCPYRAICHFSPARARIKADAAGSDQREGAE
ncbi:MAG: PD-(D/E)XK nuclease family protein [Phycisphaerae bacterium]